MPGRRGKGWVSAGRYAGPASIPSRAAPPWPRRPGCDRREVFRARKGQSTMSFPRRRTSASPDATRRDHYQEVTDQIIEALEGGVLPWRRPWNPDLAGVDAMRANATTRRRYHGINILMLALSPFAWSSGDNRWCSYKQAAERGWQVRKGERGTTVFFFKKLERKDGEGASDLAVDGTQRFIPMLRAYTVFNGSQIDGIPPVVPPTPLEVSWRRPEAVEDHRAQQRRQGPGRRRAAVLFARPPTTSRCRRTRRSIRRKATRPRYCTSLDTPPAPNTG